jgi:hypothetical protein
MTISSTLRRRLDMQGFTCADDTTLARTHLWLRWSPGLCAAITAAGTALASPTVLWTLAPFAALGAILPFHPFDLVYNLGLRHLSGGPALPRNGAPRRFACAVGSVWLITTGWLFFAGLDGAAYTLGAAFVATATLVTSAHICIPSMVYRALFGGEGLARA